MSEREKQPHSRVHLYLNHERFKALERVADRYRLDTPAEVVKRFIDLGLIVTREAEQPNYDGLYIKRDGEFIRIPFIL